MHVVRHPGAFAAEQEDIVFAVSKIRIAPCRFRRGENQPTSAFPSPCLEALPIDVSSQGDGGKIIHAGALQIAVGYVEAGRLDNVDAEAEAGGQAQDGAGVAGNVGLVEGDTQVGYGA